MLALAFAAELLRATTNPTTAATAVTTAPVNAERRVMASTDTAASSRQRDAGAGEEPDRRRQPGQDQRREHCAAQYGQQPPRHAAQPQAQHLRRVRAVEHATRHTVCED